MALFPVNSFRVALRLSSRLCSRAQSAWAVRGTSACGPHGPAGRHLAGAAAPRRGRSPPSPGRHCHRRAAGCPGLLPPRDRRASGAARWRWKEAGYQVGDALRASGALIR